MISVIVNKGDNKLKIFFDMPLPVSFERNEQCRFFIGKLSGSSELKVQHIGNSINHLSVDIEGWIAFIKEAVSVQESAFQQNILREITRGKIRELGGELKINFHQQPFDTPERYWNFILNQGNFTHYFLNRFKWYLFSRYAILAPFPLHVDIEASSTCNMSCPMCYRDQMKTTGQMDVWLFKKIVDECALNNVFSIRLSWRGEALTHPKIKEMIKYATSRIASVSFLTNAFYLDEDMINCLIKNKLSYIAVSFDGIGEIYESIRRPAKFRENYNRLSMFQQKKRKAKTKLPQIRICTIWPAIKEDPEAYYQAMQDVSDYIVCNPYINFKGSMKIKPNFICQYPWERMVIAFNGDAQCCTGWNADDIILGNVKDDSIYDMWHSDLMNKIRLLHAEGRRMEINSCANCRHGSTGDPDINIQDIINRKF